MAHHDFEMPVTEAQVRGLRVNDTVTLERTLYGIRDATLIHMFDRGRKTRFDLRGQAVIHTAPNVKKVEPSREHPAGYEPLCVGTTTSARMERFTRPLMSQYGVRMIKAEERLKAVSARDEDAAWLEVPVGQPLLSVDRVAYTYGDKPVEWRKGLCNTAAHYYYNELG